MENKLMPDMSDEELLLVYHANIELLYDEAAELKRTAPYNRRMTYQAIEGRIKDCQNEIDSAERSRRNLLERMSVKKPKEIWYKSSWFIAIVSNLLTAAATFLAAWSWK